MFTPKNIQGALEELYDLCDPDYMVDMLVNYSEEFDDISPALLAKSFQKNAEMISEYRVIPGKEKGRKCFHLQPCSCRHIAAGMKKARLMPGLM